MIDIEYKVFKIVYDAVMAYDKDNSRKVIYCFLK